MVLRRLLEDKRVGFFVDIGCYHPSRFSNTYYFYQRGWRGINIDATPGTKRLFDQVRPRDINLEAAIGEEGRVVSFFEFAEGALNSTVRDSPEARGLGAHPIVMEHVLTVEPLGNLLRRQIPPGQTVDFLSIDVEGMDMEVLRSNDWDAVRPEFVLVECWDVDAEHVLDTPLYAFMRNVGYSFCAKTYSTVFFRKKRPRQTGS
jgi:hypothetical protein